MVIKWDEMVFDKKECATGVLYFREDPPHIYKHIRTCYQTQQCHVQSKMCVTLQHSATVPDKTIDFSEHCKDCKYLLKMIVGRGPVLCGAYYTLKCTSVVSGV